LADADHHRKNADARHDLDERIHAEAQEGQCFIGNSEEDGDQPFAEVIEDGEEGEPEGVGPIFVCGIFG
jgi:hypothetical protein